MGFTDTVMLVLSTSITVCYLSSSIIFIRTVVIIVQIGYFFLALYTGLNQPGMTAILILSISNSLINSFKIAQYFYENSIHCLPSSLHNLYHNEFQLLSPKEFRIFYLRAAHEERTGELILANQTFKNLMFVLEGTPIIRLEKGRIIKLTKSVWLGEMSFLRGEVTSADVLTEPNEKVKLLIWTKKDIDELRQNQPVIIEKLRYIIANSLAEKIRNSNTLIESTFS